MNFLNHLLSLVYFKFHPLNVKPGMLPSMGLQSQPRLSNWTDLSVLSTWLFYASVSSSKNQRADSYTLAFLWRLLPLFYLVAQLCLTLCESTDCSMPGPSVYGDFQAKLRSGLPFPSPGNLPNSGIEPLPPPSLLHCRQILFHWATGRLNQVI